MLAHFDCIRNDTHEALDVTWLVDTPDVAVCVFHFRWKGEIGGEPAAGRGRGASALKRIDVVWRIVHENLSHREWRSQPVNELDN
jgi:hypothetical protein